MFIITDKRYTTLGNKIFEFMSGLYPNLTEVDIEVIPQIENFVKELDVKDQPLPITQVANALMTKEQYMKVKTRQVVLKAKKTLTIEQELELVVCENALAKERNLERIISKEKMLAKKR